MIRAAAGIPYILERKAVKNMNLRIRRDLAVIVSAHKRIPVTEIDAFVASKRDWILAALERVDKRNEKLKVQREQYSDSDCMACFEKISDRIYPLFQHLLPEKPQLKVRYMVSRYGVCHIQKRSITLNKILMAYPEEIIEYVILHEYVHFVYPDHQKGFHRLMARLMPDYLERRRQLKES